MQKKNYRLASEIQPQPTEWLWPQRIPLGEITILDGDPGSNKSCITLDLAARVSIGVQEWAFFSRGV